MAGKDKTIGSSSTMNAAFALDVLLHWPVRQSILLVGDHGIGKDGIIKTAAQMQAIPCVDIRLSQNDVGDIKGMPFRVKGRTVFAPPDWMPLKEEEEMDIEELMEQVGTAASKRAGASRGILFLNEINRAVREVRQAAFEIVLDRTMNTRALRDGWRIVSAINGDEHYQVDTMDLAFKGRFYVINFRPSTEEWLDWAQDPEIKALAIKPEVLDIVSRNITGPLHPAVIGYIRQHEEMLDPTDELLLKAESETALQVQNRRGWHMFSDMLKVREELAAIGEVPEPLSKDRDALNALMLFGMGFVGPLAASGFMNYVETDYQALSGAIILDGWNKDTEGRVKALVDAGRTVELGRYNDEIVGILAKCRDRKMSPERKANLTAYFALMPAAQLMMFYKNAINEARHLINDWYSDKAVEKMVLEAMIAKKE